MISRTVQAVLGWRVGVTRSGSGLGRRSVAIGAVLLAGFATAATPGDGAQRKGKPSGIKGVVLATTPETAGVMVTAIRVSTGRIVASVDPTGGRFRLPLRPGLYELTATGAPACSPELVCPPFVSMSCVAGETRRVRVKRHRWSRVELRNACFS
jgi:hypothetical protein